MTEPDFVFWPLRTRNGTELWRWECWGHGYNTHPDDESSKTAYAKCYRTPGRRHTTRKEAEAAAAAHAADTHPDPAKPVNNEPTTATQRAGNTT